MGDEGHAGAGESGVDCQGKRAVKVLSEEKQALLAVVRILMIRLAERDKLSSAWLLALPLGDAAISGTVFAETAAALLCLPFYACPALPLKLMVGRRGEQNLVLVDRRREVLEGFTEGLGYWPEVTWLNTRMSREVWKLVVEKLVNLVIGDMTGE